jgi:hypothetical protein
MHPFVIPFTTVWFGMVFLSIVTGLSSSPSIVASPTQVLPVGMMLLFGFGGVRFGRYQSRGDRQALLAFVRETLMAEPA